MNRIPHQKINRNGRIQAPVQGWFLRIGALIIIGSMIIYNIIKGIDFHDPLLVYSTIMPIHAFMMMCVGWFFFRNSHRIKTNNDLVSVIIPIYNQSSMIMRVIDAIFQSTYKNIEVIAVNDGSTDLTGSKLQNLADIYPRLKIITKANEGKRRAVAAGFYVAKGNYLVLIDSDSIIDKKAIEELMRTLLSDNKIGAVVGEAKIWNAKNTIFTKLQDVWYDYAFNIHKAAESVFGCVTCCSGCLSAYRREAIENFIPYWAKATFQFSDDRELTSYVIASGQTKADLKTVFGNKFWVQSSQDLMESMAKFDDAEDRGLTAHSLLSWKTVYAPKAVVYTDVPETWHGYLKQQLRWKKGYIRTNFFVNSFFWKKNPIIALIFYTEVMATFTAPLITVIILFYEPFILGHYFITFIFICGMLLIGIVQGFDYKGRVPKSRYWYYRPIMNLFITFVLSWLLIPALLRIRKNEWLTR
jgi:hyaluronan synthase